MWDTLAWCLVVGFGLGFGWHASAVLIDLAIGVFTDDE